MLWFPLRCRSLCSTVVGTLTPMEVVVPTVSIRDLAHKASAVVDEVAKSGKPAVVTKRGKPIAAVVPIDPDALDDWVLANAPEYVKARRDADLDLAAGRTVSLEDLRDELAAE